MRRISLHGCIVMLKIISVIIHFNNNNESNKNSMFFKLDLFFQNLFVDTFKRELCISLTKK